MVAWAPAVIEVVDGDPTTRPTLVRLLRQARYRVVSVHDVAMALRRPPGPAYDATVVALADADGLGALTQLRARTPTIIALAPIEVADVVAALDAGADDYLVQPVNPEELLARLRAALRRHRAVPARATIVTADFTVDLGGRRLTRGGYDIHLTPTEWAILELLASQPDRLVSHDQILRAVWGPGKLDKVVYLRVYVAALRRKLEPDRTNPHYLLTEPGYGYRLRPE